MRVLLALMMTGCATVSGLGPAMPLEPGQNEWVVDMGLQAGGNALSRSSGIPLPRTGIGYRKGLRPDLDMGVRIYPAGIHADLRIRLLQHGPWHVAVAPGVGGAAVLTPSVGWTEGGIILPVLVERELGHGFSVTSGVENRTVLRGGWLAPAQSPGGQGTHLDQYLGGGLGLTFRNGGLRVGWQFSGALSVLRPGAPTWTTGPEFGIGPKSQKPRME